MEEKNKSVKNVKVNQENVKKNFQYKLKRAFAIVGTVIVIGSGIGIHFSREKDKENVNSYLSGISVSESISEYEQLKQIKIEDIKDWLEISEDSIKYEDEVVKILKDNTDYKPELHIVNSLDEYKKAVETIERLHDVKVLSPEQKDLLIKAALILSKNAQLANEKLMKYGYNLVEKETLRLLKEDFAKHVGINFEDPSEIEIGIVDDELMTPYISVNVNGKIYECTGYPYDIAQIIAAVQRAKTGVSKESDLFGRNEGRNDVLIEALEACKIISSGATDEVNWNIKVPKYDSEYYNPIKCNAPSSKKIITSSKANLTEGRSR